MAATSTIGDSPLFLIDYGLRIVRVLVMLSLWRILFAGVGQVGGLTLAAVLTYTLIAEIFSEQFAVQTDIEVELWQGTLSQRFLRPMSIVGQFAAEVAGRWSLGLVLCSLPLLLLAPLLGIDPRPAGPLAVLLFVPSLLLAITVGLALDLLFGALTVMLDQGPFAIAWMRQAIGALLSGLVLPLTLLPWGLGEIFAWLPFAAMAAAPLQIYTGVGNPLPLLAIQAGWAVALWPLVGWLWRSQQERLAVYGG